MTWKNIPYYITESLLKKQRTNCAKKKGEANSKKIVVFLEAARDSRKYRWYMRICTTSTGWYGTQVCQRFKIMVVLVIIKMK